MQDKGKFTFVEIGNLWSHNYVLICHVVNKNNTYSL